MGARDLEDMLTELTLLTFKRLRADLAAQSNRES